MSKDKEINYLSDWDTLHDNVKKLDEKTLLELIEKEKKSEARPQFLIRLYGRYNKLRGTRERKEMLSSKK